VVEDRSSEDDPVHERRRHTDVGAGRELAHHPAGGRAVQVEVARDPRMERRDDERPAVVDEADVAHEGLVEDRLDGLAVVPPALRMSTYACA
jgi:hypothetical protein